MVARFVPSNVAEMVDWLAGTVTAQTGMILNIGAGGASGDLVFKTNTATRLSVSFNGNVSLTDHSSFVDGRNRVSFPATQANAVAADSGLYPRSLLVQGTAKGNNGKTGQGMFGVVSAMADAAGVVNKTITAMSRSGSTLTVTASSHGFSNGDRVVIYGVTSTFNVSPNAASYVVANVAANTFEITVTGLSSGTYTNGGTVTNRPYMVGFYAQVNPSLDRNTGMTGAVANCDDVTPFIAQNVGTGEASEAYYVASAPNISGSAYQAALGIGGKVAKGITFGNAVATYGIDFWHSTSASYGTAAIRIPNSTAGGKIYGRNNADSADVSLILVNNSDNIVLGDATNAAIISVQNDLSMNGKNISTSGTKFGLLSSNLISFWGATPITQPTANTDLRTVLISTGLLASGGASPLDLNGGTLTAAKAVLGTNAATTGVLNIPNASPVYGRNAANDADVNLFTVDTNDHFKFNTAVAFADGVHIVLGTSSGSKIGTATSQLLGFYNATPIAQPAATTDIVAGLTTLGLRAAPNLETPTIKASPVIGAAKDVQIFNQGTNQTWTKPATGNVAVIVVKGAGGGGGGGTTGSASINGGAGGGAGGWLVCAVPLAALGSTCNVNVAAGGAGGTAGNAGSNASGTTAFDSAGGNANVTAATGGSAGGAGSPTGGSGGTATAPTYSGYAVTSASTNGGTGGASSSFVGQAGATGAGGGGGGINAGPTAQAGGAGNLSGPTATANGSGGAAGAGASAQNGAPSISQGLHFMATNALLGGGGGGGATGGSGKNAGAGAYGVGGGGGGGGGSCVTGGTAGAGGAGGDGCVVVLVY